MLQMDSYDVIVIYIYIYINNETLTYMHRKSFECTLYILTFRRLMSTIVDVPHR